MAYSKEYYLANKEKYAARSLAWRLANPDRAKENRKRYYEANKVAANEYSTKTNRFKRTGVTDEQYQDKLKEQHGVCAICFNKCTKQLAADHNHKTGTFRGLLCNNCNRGLGHFKDDSILLRAATRYLEERDY